MWYQLKCCIKVLQPAAANHPNMPPVCGRRVDGGWAWVVLAANFLCSMLISAMYTSGVFNVAFLQEFGLSKARTALLASTQGSLSSLISPVATVLHSRLGTKWTVVLGGGLTTAGYLFSCFATDFIQMFLTFGVLAGIGFGICYIPICIALGLYFDRYRNIACAISSSAYGLGVMAFSPLCQHLLSEYGLRGTMLILAGIQMNSIPLAFIFVPPDIVQVDTEVVMEAEHLVDEGSLTQVLEVSLSRDLAQYSPRLSYPAPFNELSANLNGGDDLKSCERSDMQMSDMDDENVNCRRKMSVTSTAGNGGSYLCSHNELHRIQSFRLKRTKRHRYVSENVFYTAKASPQLSLDLRSTQSLGNVHGHATSSSTMKIPGGLVNHHLATSRHKSIGFSNNSLPDALARLEKTKYLRDTQVLEKGPAGDGRGDNEACCTAPTHEGVQKLLRLLLDWRLGLYNLNLFAVYSSISLIYAHLTAYAMTEGATFAEASSITSWLGLASIVCNLLTGLVATHPAVNIIVLYAMTTTIAGCILLLVPVLMPLGYPGQAAAALLTGLTGWSYATMLAPITIRLFGLSQFAVAYGVEIFVCGVAFIAGPLVAGWVYDVTQSYQYTFYIASCGYFIGAMCMVVIFMNEILKRHRHSQGLDTSQCICRQNP